MFWFLYRDQVVLVHDNNHPLFEEMLNRYRRRISHLHRISKNSAELQPRQDNQNLVLECNLQEQT